MPCARPDVIRRPPLAVIAALALAMAPHAAAMTPSADEILIAAERQRGIPRPHTFAASIAPTSDDGVRGATSMTRVEVRSNGFAQQLVIVLEPSRGDAMLSTPDVVWVRPRRLHRLTRIPPELRMFSAASVGDVTAIDLLDLTARADVRYPRASYTIARDDFRPLQIDFEAASGKILKTVTYGAFTRVFDRVIPTELVVHDRVYRDASVVRLSDFRPLAPVDPAMFTPDYLLTLGDDT